MNLSGHIKYIHILNHSANIKTLIVDILLADFSQTEQLLLTIYQTQCFFKCSQGIHREIPESKKSKYSGSFKTSYGKPKDINSILLEICFTPEEYYDTLKISTDNYFQVHFKRKPNSYFVNNYFTEVFETNIDIQPVINHYKAVAYMCAYFSKSEDEPSEAMKQEAKEAVKENLNVFEKMKVISKAYMTKREYSVQEAVYHIM